MRKGSFMTVGLIISIIFILNFSVRAVPMLINYQGKLIDVDGKLLDGDYIINFYLYKEEDNGTAIWSEEQTVTVTKGIFNTQLGAGKGDPLSLDLFDNDKLYLEIRIHNPDAESIETLLPRQRLTSTAYAIKAGDAKKSFVNVRDFGAIGDGNTPDNEAIQSAVDYTHNAGIGAVFLPRGIYLLRRAIKLKDPINLFGGGDTSILKCGVLADDPHDIHYNCVIYITGNNIQLNSFAINGNRVNIEGLSPSSSHGIFSYGNNCTFKDLKIYGTEHSGILLYGSPTHNLIDNCRIFDIGRIGIGAFASYTTISNCQIWNCELFGIEPGYPGVGNHSNTVIDNIVFDCNGHNILLGSYRTTVSRNICYGSANCGISLPFAGYTNNFDNKITGNICYNNAATGIYAYNVTQNIITNNICFSNGSDNTIDYWKRCGILLRAVYKSVISNNITYDNATHGFALWYTGENVLSGNFSYENRLENYKDISHNKDLPQWEGVNSGPMVLWNRPSNYWHMEAGGQGLGLHT